MTNRGYPARECRLRRSNVDRTLPGLETSVWYICAMKWKGLAVFGLMLLVGQGLLAAAGQETDRPVPATGQAVPHATTPAASRPLTAPHTGVASHPSTAQPAASSANMSTPVPPSDCETGPCDDQPAHISIATPAPAPAPWPWQDRIAWVANLVLVILGYAGIVVALSLLKKIDRQTQYAESAAQAAETVAKAAAESAQAVLLQAQAVARAERPWVLVTVEPSRKVENGFMVVATNRGRTPARILSAVDTITIEIDQAKLPEPPQYDDAQPNASLASVILLPGESTGIKPFGRDDVKGLCKTEEKLKRVGKWEEMILLYGKIAYQDLVEEGNVLTRETGWCCWYIHGRQNSGMVMAGSPTYNRHT
jgi:hypothetical protein